MSAEASPSPSRLRAFWAWARVPIFIAAVSRVALWWFAYVSLMWFAPSRPRILPGRPFLEPWFRWDAGWYMQIVNTGYSLFEPEPGQRNVVFFPLYPMLVRGFGWLIRDPYLSAFVLSNVFFIVAMVVLYRFVLERWNAGVAEKTVALMAVGPHALYFSACYTESLFLLCWVAAFYAAHRQRWLAAGVFIALSGATRGVGGIAMLGVGLMALEHVGWKVRALSWRVLFIGVGVLGLASYMAFLHFQFGDMWLFTGVTAVRGWGAGRDMSQVLHYFNRIIDLAAWANGTQPMAEISHLVALTVASVLCLVGWKRVGPSLTIFTAATLFIYWRVWYSASRYVAVLFPVFIVLAVLLEHRHRRFVAVLFTSTIFLTMFTWLFAHFEWVS